MCLIWASMYSITAKREYAKVASCTGVAHRYCPFILISVKATPMLHPKKAGPKSELVQRGGNCMLHSFKGSSITPYSKGIQKVSASRPCSFSLSSVQAYTAKATLGCTLAFNRFHSYGGAICLTMFKFSKGYLL